MSSYPDMPITSIEAKYFYCEVCSRGLLSKRDRTSCPTCNSIYEYRRGRMVLVQRGALPEEPGVSSLQEELEEETQTVDLTPPVPILPSSGQVLSIRCPLTGILKEVMIHWPQGCNALVQIRAGVRQAQLAPYTGYHALDDATKSYPFHLSVLYGERLWAEIRNTDLVNAHMPAIHFIVFGKRKEWNR